MLRRLLGDRTRRAVRIGASVRAVSPTFNLARCIADYNASLAAEPHFSHRSSQ